jgi:hypothetical protein
MVRAAFEATEHILIISTDDAYPRLGTRALLFYEQKDQALGPAAAAGKPGFVDLPEGMQSIWERAFPDARAMVAAENASLARLRSGSTFVDGDIAEHVDESYRRLASRLGHKSVRRMAWTNRQMYAYLSRETHACLRFKPRTLKVYADGSVEALPESRDAGIVRRNAYAALESCAQEAIAALEYRRAVRRESAVKGLLLELETAPPELRAGHLPDFGIQLLRSGAGHMTLTVPSVRLDRFRTLPDGTISSTSKAGDDGEDASLVSFDFRGASRRKLLDLLSDHDPDRTASFLRNQPLERLDLREPIELALTASLGVLQRSPDQTFVPLIVHGLRLTSDPNGETNL